VGRGLFFLFAKVQPWALVVPNSVLNVSDTSERSGEWRRITFDTCIEITDRVALAAAAFDGVVVPASGEESKPDWPSRVPELQLQSYLSEVLTRALLLIGEQAGFSSRTYANVTVGTPDDTGNFPAFWMFPQPGPNGLPMHEAYPDTFPPSDQEG
jgi:hypothetical protein